MTKKKHSSKKRKVNYKAKGATKIQKILSVGMAGLLTTSIIVPASVGAFCKQEEGTIKASVDPVEVSPERVDRQFLFKKEVESIVEQKKIEQERARIIQEHKNRETQQRREKVTFNPYDVTVKSNISASELYQILPSDMRHLSIAFEEAEKIYGVNSLFLAGLVSQESGFGTSSRAKSTNNLTGLGVNTPSSRGYIHDSQEESIMETARQLSVYYLTPGGTYYNGQSVREINIKYCQTEIYPGHWSDSIVAIANKYLEEFRCIFLQ